MPVRTFNLPMHLFRGSGETPPSKDEIDAAYAEPTPEGLILNVGGRVFQYDRLGVRPDA